MVLNYVFLCLPVTHILNVENTFALIGCKFRIYTKYQYRTYNICEKYVSKMVATYFYCGHFKVLGPLRRSQWLECGPSPVDGIVFSVCYLLPCRHYSGGREGTKYKNYVRV